MMERNGPPDVSSTLDDVASIYSWANLNSTAYRNFPASQAQIRERARQRVEQVLEQERLRTRQEASPAVRPDLARTEEDNPTSREDDEQKLEPTARQPVARSEPESDSRAWSAPASDTPPRPDPAPSDDSATVSHGIASAPHFPFTAAQSPEHPAQAENYVPPRIPWQNPGASEAAARPAWLTSEHVKPPSQLASPSASQDALQGSDARLASRWFALRGALNGAQPAQVAQSESAARPPVLAVFSLAGGVGKTSLVATLGRALSARGERVLLVDTAGYSLLPFFFGAWDQRPALLRTFCPPASSGDAPVQMIALDPASFGPVAAAPDALIAEISKHARGVGRIIVDLATGADSTTRRIEPLSPQILVPLVPDMNSVVSVRSIDAFFHTNSNSPGKLTLPHYVLNRFDSSLPLHLDMREVLRDELGDRLLPFVLRRTPAVSEALAEGMTVIDYAPNSALADDFLSLAGWVKSLSAPAASGFRGVRWSER